MGLFRFQCESCESTKEWSGSVNDKPESIACECGGRQTQLLGMPAVIVHSAPHTTTEENLKRMAIEESFARAKAAGNGKILRDAKVVGDRRKRAEEVRRSAHAKSDAPRLVASVPKGAMQAYNVVYGKGAIQEMDKKDQRKILKNDGFWFDE